MFLCCLQNLRLFDELLKSELIELVAGNVSNPSNQSISWIFGDILHKVSSLVGKTKKHLHESGKTQHQTSLHQSMQEIIHAN
jgi:hypothetical protein